MSSRAERRIYVFFGSNASIGEPLMRKILLLFIFCVAVVPCLAQQKPKVRAITAFVRLQPGHYQGEARAALAFLRRYDDLAQKENFDTSMGPALMSDADDPAVARLLAEALAGTKILEGSIIIAGDDGIHWKAIAAAADVIKDLEEHSPHSQANFNFAATAMLPPLAPFYPGSYHTGAGH